jgi:hypothetical protein
MIRRLVFRLDKNHTFLPFSTRQPNWAQAATERLVSRNTEDFAVFIAAEETPRIPAASNRTCTALPSETRRKPDRRARMNRGLSYFFACTKELLSMKIVDFLDCPAWAIILGFKDCPVRDA